jgi:type 2A phosphatase activator TIP41
MPKTVLTKPYDWTYTTTYPGHFELDPGSSSLSHPLWKPADPENPLNVIPLAELSRQDPILFYAEVPLFEDELHDNGASSLIVRIVIIYSLFHTVP